MADEEVSNVVSLQEARDKRDPHMTGRAVCLDCKQAWRAVVPVGVVWLTCPQCNLNRGRLIDHVEIDAGYHWTCGCGCNLFHVTPESFYCPNCGKAHPR